jgi:hypothetical protein
MGILVGDSEKKERTKQIRPKVINYTMEDGSQRQGLLLPKDYDPDEDLPTSVNMLPEAAAAYLMDFAANYHHLRVGEARIFKVNRDRCYIEVPKSKARGLKYFGDRGLTDIVGDFETWRTAMRADFDAEDLISALEYLKARGNAIKCDGRDPDTAREYNNNHRDKGIAEGEEYGFAAEAKKKPRVIPKKLEAPKRLEKVTSAKEIIKFLSDAFGVPFRGKATHRRKEPGWYNLRTRGIRLKNVNSLRVACHEIGHHIDSYLNNRWSKDQSDAWWGIGAELARMGKALYGRKRPKGGYKAEGYAEFVFGWLTKGIDLKQEAPRTLQFFEKEYLPDNPEIADILKTAREMVKHWQDQGADARFQSMINRKHLLAGLKDKVKKGLSLWWQTMMVDEFTPLRKALEEAGVERGIERPTKDPAYLAEYFTQKEGARARQMVLHYTIDIWGNRTGPGLKQILKPVANRIEDFTKYMVAARAIKLRERKIESGFDINDAQYIYLKYHSPEWATVAKEVTEWNHRVLDYVVQAGALERSVANRMRDLNPIYLPFMRAFAPGEKQVRKGTGQGLITTAKAVHAIKGSGREIIDPFESMIQQTRRMIAIAHKTMIARSLVELEAGTEGIAGLIWRVPPPLQAIKVDAAQVVRQLQKMGMPLLLSDIDDATLTIYSNSPIYLGKDNIISVVINGKRLFYEVDKDLLRVLKGLDKFVLPKVLNLTFGKAGRLMRLGATGINAAFGLVKNPIRDSLDTIFKARHARGPLASLKGVAKDISRTGLAKALGIKPNKAAQDFVAMGGQISGFVGQDRKSTQHLRGEMLASSAGRFTIHTVRHPIDAIREVFGVPEAGPRIQEYEKALQYWMDRYQPAGGEPPPDAKVYAFLSAQDQTINYSRHGVIGKWLNQMIPFWNANAQDPSKVVRVFRERGKQATLYALVYLTLPAAALWWLNKDKKWYKSLPAYEKANYLHVKIPDKDVVVRVPVPFLVGHIFQGMPVAVLDSLYNTDPKAVTNHLKQIYEQDVTPLYEWPALISPIIEVLQNKDWTGRPIVPRAVEGKLPSDQYKEHTSEFCKALGKVFRISPAQIEHLLNSWSGGLYRRTAVGAERAARMTEGEMVPADWPVIGPLFVRDPYAPKAAVERFYQEKERLNRLGQSEKLKPGSPLARKRRRYNYIGRYLSKFWEQLRKQKTVAGRKRSWKKIEDLIRKAEKTDGKNKLQ